jgi:hypothetical protein
MATVLTKDFQDALTKLALVEKQPGVFPGVIKMQADNGILRMTVSSYNNQLTAKIKATGDGIPICYYHSVNELSKASKFFGDYVSVSVVDDKVLISDGKKSIQKNKLCIEGEFPDLEAYYRTKDGIVTGSMELGDVLKKYKTIKYAISENDTRPMFSGCVFYNNTIFGVDVYRAAICKGLDVPFENQISIPVVAMEIMTKIFKSKVSFAHFRTITPAIFFSDNSYDFITKLIDVAPGNEVTFEKFVPNEFVDEFLVDAKEMENAAKYFETFCNKNNDDYIVFVDDRMVTNEAEYKLPNNISCKTIIGFDPKKFKEAMCQFSGTITMKLAGTTSPAIFEQGDDMALLLPIRIDNKRMVKYRGESVE